MCSPHQRRNFDSLVAQHTSARASSLLRHRATGRQHHAQRGVPEHVVRVDARLDSRQAGQIVSTTHEGRRLLPSQRLDCIPERWSRGQVRGGQTQTRVCSKAWDGERGKFEKGRHRMGCAGHTQCRLAAARQHNAAEPLPASGLGGPGCWASNVALARGWAPGPLNTGLTIEKQSRLPHPLPCPPC